jgi:hypothetical protein
MRVEAEDRVAQPVHDVFGRQLEPDVEPVHDARDAGDSVRDAGNLLAPARELDAASQRHGAVADLDVDLGALEQLCGGQCVEDGRFGVRVSVALCAHQPHLELVVEAADARDAARRAGGLPLLEDAADRPAQGDVAVAHLHGDLVGVHEPIAVQRFDDRALHLDVGHGRRPSMTLTSFVTPVTPRSVATRS